LTAWLALQRLRERRRMKEIETKADEAKAESERQAQQLAAINGLASSVTRMSEAQISRSEAQDRERAALDIERKAWRELIEAQGAQVAAMVAGGMEMSNAVNHQTQAIDKLRAGLKQEATMTVEEVNAHTDAGLGDVQDALATIWDTLEGLTAKFDSHSATPPEVATAIREVLEVVRAIQSRMAASAPLTDDPDAPGLTVTPDEAPADAAEDAAD
jgi:chromosome segregation ATPase